MQILSGDFLLCIMEQCGTAPVRVMAWQYLLLQKREKHITKSHFRTNFGGVSSAELTDSQELTVSSISGRFLDKWQKLEDILYDKENNWMEREKRQLFLTKTFNMFSIITFDCITVCTLAYLLEWIVNYSACSMQYSFLFYTPRVQVAQVYPQLSNFLPLSHCQHKIRQINNVCYLYVVIRAIAIFFMFH